MKRPPKYKKVLEDLMAMIEKMGPREQLPRIRELKVKYGVGQSTIERALDEIVRLGLVNRKWGSGIYINEPRVKSGVIGVYSDTSFDSVNQSFLDGARSVLGPRGYKLKGIGISRPDNKEMLATLTEEPDFDGVIVKFSEQNMLVAHQEQFWSKALSKLKIPVSVYRPVPWSEFDSVTPDFTSAFMQLGSYLHAYGRGPIRFIGNYSVPTFFRLWGLRSGLQADYSFETVIELEGPKEIAQTLIETLESGWVGNIVVGGYIDPETLNEIFRKYSTQHLENQDIVVVSRGPESLEVDFDLHLVVKTGFDLGEATAKMLLRRLCGYQGSTAHEIMPETLYMAKKSKSMRSGA